MAGGSGRGHEHPIPPVPSSRRHCWVRGAQGAPGPHAGLVHEWIRRGDEWWALVTYVIEQDGVSVQQWLPADVLTPVGA